MPRIVRFVAVAVACFAVSCGHAVATDFAALAPNDGTGLACDSEEQCTARCNDGGASACTTLGLWFTLGKNRKPDLAADHLRRGCEGRDPRGCAWLGLMYESSLGPIKKDPVRAVELYGSACDGGNAMGCFRLGWAYQDGRGVEQNLERAAPLFAKACDGRYAAGCLYLGDMQADHMVPPDRAGHAAKLFAEICDRPRLAAISNVGTCGALARLYEEGRGVARDPARATFYFQKGCDVGDGASCEALKRR